MSPQGYKNMDLESQDPIFNANLGQDENLIWTKKLRCSHSIRPPNILLALTSDWEHTKSQVSRVVQGESHVFGSKEAQHL